MELETTCELLRGPTACATQPNLCTYDYSDGECLTKTEFEIETELKCEVTTTSLKNISLYQSQFQYSDLETHLEEAFQLYW